MVASRPVRRNDEDADSVHSCDATHKSQGPGSGTVAVMDTGYTILNSRKRALIALVHTVFFLLLATWQSMGTPKTASLLWHRDASVIAGGIVYCIVTSVLVWLLAISTAAREKLYFGLCAASAATALVRMIVGEMNVPGGGVARVVMLGCAVIVGVAILRESASAEA